MQAISDIKSINPVFDDVITAECVTQTTTTRPLTHSAASYPAEDEDGESFDARLLRALATMAVRSKRRQADISAAVHRGGLASQVAYVSTALRALELAGYIEDIVPLYDGGLLVSVTSRGIEQLHATPRWARFESETIRG